MSHNVYMRRNLTDCWIMLNKESKTQINIHSISMEISKHAKFNDTLLMDTCDESVLNRQRNNKKIKKANSR